MMVGVAVLIHPLPFFTTTWYVLGTRLVMVLLIWKVAPLSKLYVTPFNGEVTVIEPVATVQLGCVVVV